MPITKRPCSNCPFRCDDKALALHPERLKSIVNGLLEDDTKTFICHKTLNTEKKTCAGAAALLDKLGRPPLIIRLGLIYKAITPADIEASKKLVIEPEKLGRQKC